jgi:hypothetical protein
MIHTSALVRITKASCRRHGYAVAALGDAGLIKARVKVKSVLSRYARARFFVSLCSTPKICITPESFRPDRESSHSRQNKRTGFVCCAQLFIWMWMRCAQW